MTTYLVKVRSQEVYLGLVLEETRPVLFLEFLLAQDKLNVCWGMVGL